MAAVGETTQRFLDSSKRLVKYGFTTDKFKQDFPNWKALSPEQKEAELNKLVDSEKIEQYAAHDEMEVTKDQIVKLPHPKALSKYHMIYEVPHESIEPIYYWCLGNLQADLGYPVVEKISDIFTAAEHSSFYGASAQRLGLAQDKVAQYLATIGKMVKDMFQLVREIRWIDERIKYYEDADKGYEGAEIALKGLWTDMVDGVVGGQRTSSNIFVMAQQLQFSALPDLFFSIHVTKDIIAKVKGKPVDKVEDSEIREQIDKFVNKQAEGFNKELQNLLKRKLYQYQVWRAETRSEIKQRKTFTIQYLAQHYQIIKMYMTWVKPYLKHIQKLGSDVTKINSAELISAFEGSLVEIEILGKQRQKGHKNAYSCILITLQYRTRPQMQFSQEGGYHRGPLHQGETKIFWRAYGWTDEEIENFKKMKDEEDLELIKTIDASLGQAMESLGGDLRKYLEEAKTTIYEKKKTEGKGPQKLPGLFEPFAELGKGFTDSFAALIPKPKKEGPNKEKINQECKVAGKVAKSQLWAAYKIFKKAHRLLTW
jgi:hypothetical protein